MNLNVKDFENSAKKLLDSSIFDFFYGGATDEFTLQNNVSSYNTLNLLPNVLRAISEPDTSVSFFGQKLQTPILIAPMAFQRLAHRDGELATAKGADKIKTTMVISSYSTTQIDTLVSELSIPPWYQLYILKDRGITKAMIQLAETVGCQALVLTVDVPAYGKRERELRNPLKMDILLPDLLKIGKSQSTPFDLSHAKHLSDFLDHSTSWQDVEWIQSITKLPLILKGILREDDARQAMSAGVHGIIISNHGGRQLDTTPPAIFVLPKIAQAVGDSLEILIDGGIRRGTDVFKAIALGAKGVLIGRPIIWGLATEGETGVYKILTLLNEELKLAMIQCGCKKVINITQNLIHDFN